MSFTNEQGKTNKIAVLIPCFNEAGTIAKVVREYRSALPEAVIMVCDNHSSDGTGEIAQAAGASVIVENTQGKGAAMRRLFASVDAECYFMVDGDDTYPPQQAREMCALVLKGAADMVIGDRLSSSYFSENKRMFHGEGNHLIRFLVNLFWGGGHTYVKDILTGSRALSRDFVQSYHIRSDGFEIETEMTIFALKHHFTIKNIPIPYKDRPRGSESKLKTISDGRKILWLIFKEALMK